MNGTNIAFVHGRRVWDSRGRPTVEAEITLENGHAGRAIAPAGASTGSGEAVDLRDGGPAFGGYDVQRAVAHVNTDIARAVIGMNAMEQSYIDLLDGYRMALGLWSEVRAHYSPDAPEVAAATSHLESLEQELTSFSQPNAGTDNVTLSFDTIKTETTTRNQADGSSQTTSFGWDLKNNKPM